MIVRETADHFICYKQHDHAMISGEVAKAWRKDFLPSSALFEETAYAITHHDDGWMIPDEQPVWNDALHQPASFIHYPLPLKLHFYTQAINTLQNDYAKLLCSMHYASFFANAQAEAEKEFLLNETLRQNELQNRLNTDMVLLSYHFRMLQFCDDLSLFICLHEPLTTPDKYHEWFKNGFRRSENLTPLNRKIEISWKNESVLELSPSPLQQQLSMLLPFKRINKQECKTKGMAAVWKETPVAHFTFTVQ